MVQRSLQQHRKFVKLGRFVRSILSVRWQSLPLLALLFMLAMAMPLVGIQIAQNPAVAQVQPGKASYETGNFEQAARELQAAVANFAAQGDRLSQAVALRNLSLIYQHLGQWQAAKEAIANSLTLLQAQPKSEAHQKRLAEALDVQGRLQQETGKAADAVETWQQATNLYQEIGDVAGVAQSRINQAFALQDLGFYPRACNTLREALGLSPQISTPTESRRQQCSLSEQELQTLKKLPVSPINVLGLRSLGDVMNAMGELEASQRVLQQSLEAARQLQSPQEIAAAQLSLGKNAVTQANKNAKVPNLRNELRQSALNAYKAAERSPSPMQQLQAQLNQLSLFVEMGAKSEAFALLQPLQQSLMRLPPSRASVYAQVNFAQSLLQLAASDQTKIESNLELILNRAMQQAQALGDVKSQAYVYNSLGRLYELNQQWSQAESVTLQALNLAPTLIAPDIAYQLFWQLGRIHKAQGKSKQAIADYTQAVNTLTALRSDLVTINPDVQFSFRESVEPVYRQLVSLLLQPTGREKSQPGQENLKQARQVIESLQLAELDNFFQDACAEAKPKQIDQVDPTAAVIYPIILSDRLEVILSIPGQPLRHYTTLKSQTQLEQLVQQTRRAMRPTAFARERLPLLQQLYDWLIRPAEAELANSGIKTLVFVPDGILRNLPMAVLYDGEQYLIQKYSIALTPGLQLLESRPFTAGQLSALTGALSESREGFPPLPGTINEVEQIAAELPTKVLLDKQFTRAQLQDLLRTVAFPVVHLATHGQFSSNADDTFILAWDGPINVKQLDQLLRTRTPGQQKPIELFVLSACETASGDNRAALGLAGVAIRSGARSTLATLWQVNDESTALFMTQFYEQLAKPGATKAEAIRNAQLALLQNREYQNPYFWAPFVLVGNWQ